MLEMVGHGRKFEASSRCLDRSCRTASFRQHHHACTPNLRALIGDDAEETLRRLADAGDGWLWQKFDDSL
jgi:hypothetical protein